MPRLRKRHEYKRIDGDITIVHVIEMVTEAQHEADVEEILEQYLRNYSHAIVVDRFTVAGTFDHNSDILDSRANFKEDDDG